MKWKATLDYNPNSYENKIIGKSATHFLKEQILELGGEFIWSNAPENPYLN
jgi:putative transcriptional regulator